MGNFGSKNPKTNKKGSLPEIYPSDSTNTITRNGTSKISTSARTTPRSAKNTEFQKSLSMYELRRKSRVSGSITGESLPENDVNDDTSPTTYQTTKGLKQSVRRLGSNGEEKR